MTSARPQDLPNFKNPPVVETVLSVQFAPLTEFRTVHLGLLWEKFRSEFKKTEDRPSLDPVVEQFPEVPRPRFGLQLKAVENTPVPRQWFVAEQGNEMIQIQPDRFIKNWRKEGTGEHYPRFESCKANFERDFGTFTDFLAAHKLGSVRINQCEVTYVNHILAGKGWEEFGDYDRIFRFWTVPESGVLRQREDARAHLRFVIPGPQGAPIGRLHASVQPAFQTSDNNKMYVFELTARGQAGELFDFFDIGSAAIVKSFAALTTREMHKVWERTDALGDT